MGLLRGKFGDFLECYCCRTSCSQNGSSLGLPAFICMPLRPGTPPGTWCRWKGSTLMCSHSNLRKYILLNVFATKFIYKPLLLETKGKNINRGHKWNFEVERTSALNSEPPSLLLMTGALGRRTRHVLNLRDKNEVS